MTTDGRFVHALSSPKRHVGKCYRITLKHPAEHTLAEKLLRGVFLKDEQERITADHVEQIDEHTLDMTSRKANTIR